jgi:ABC-type dipeptide/oligopeptide/nickel transport system ATPase subunit
LEGSLDARDRSDRLGETLSLVHLREAHLGRYPNELTASEQQRVGVGRAIATDPDLVILDEPTSTLDQRVRAEILDVLVDLQDRLGSHFIVIARTGSGRTDALSAILVQRGSPGLTIERLPETMGAKGGQHGLLTFQRDARS